MFRLCEEHRGGSGFSPITGANLFTDGTRLSRGTVQTWSNAPSGNVQKLRAFSILLEEVGQRLLRLPLWDIRQAIRRQTLIWHGLLT